jgi:FkbM family methyltransferase
MKLFIKVLRRIARTMNCRLIEENEYSIDRILRLYFGGQREPVFFDVGANVGQTVARLKKICPSCKIFCFEPQLNALAELKDKYGSDGNVKINDFALGSEVGKLELGERIKSGTTSFNEYNRNSTYVSAKISVHKVPEMEDLIVRKYMVEVETIDNFTQRFGDVDLLKIDVEGFEESVIKGAEQAISSGKFKFIEVELTLDNRFEKRGNFYDIEKYLVPRGYTIAAFDDLYSAVHRPIFHLNALYVRNDILESFEWHS